MEVIDESETHGETRATRGSYGDKKRPRKSIIGVWERWKHRTRNAVCDSARRLPMVG